MADTEDGNEHALKWVIDNVESLCEEYVKAPENDDGKVRMHLELSTVKVLDELETPTVNHAKHEVQLLTRLLESLSQLHGHCEKTLDSSEVTVRLKSLREEMQKLFGLSPVCSIKSVGVRPKRITIHSPIAKLKSDDQTSSVLAPERTKTPTEEALRPGHEKERSSRVSEFGESTLRKLRKQFSGKSDPKSENSSMDTRAIKTASPVSAQPEERSQRIWMEEDLSQPVKRRMVRELRAPTQRVSAKLQAGSSEDTDAIRTPTEDGGNRSAGEGANLMGVDEEPTILKDELQNPPEPRQAQLIHLPQMMDVEFAVQQESEPPCINRKLVLGIAIIVLLVLVLWAIVFVFSGRSGVGWRIACDVANAFCENYGLCCTDYCASGLQRDQWQRRR